MARTALYRFYDDEDQLLYVGITDDIAMRWAAHAARKHWWGNVARKEIDWHEDRLSAIGAERDAVVNDRPLYNVIYAPDRGRKVRIPVRLRPHGRRPAAPFYALVVATLAKQGKTKVQLHQQTGISRTAIDNWARQPRPPMAGTVLAVADALGIDRDEALRLAGVVSDGEVHVSGDVLDLSEVDTEALLAEVRRRIKD